MNEQHESIDLSKEDFQKDIEKDFTEVHLKAVKEGQKQENGEITETKKYENIGIVALNKLIEIIQETSNEVKTKKGKIINNFVLFIAGKARNYLLSDAKERKRQERVGKVVARFTILFQLFLILNLIFTVFYLIF